MDFGPGTFVLRLATPYRMLRQQLVKFRTVQTNDPHGLLAECGEVMPRIRRVIHAVFQAPVLERLPGMATETLRQWARVLQLDEEMAQPQFQRLRQGATVAR